MKFNKLGQSDLEISSYCLGSMTWGEATSEDDGHWQLDFSIGNGINDEELPVSNFLTSKVNHFSCFCLSMV